MLRTTASSCQRNFLRRAVRSQISCTIQNNTNIHSSSRCILQQQRQRNLIIVYPTKKVFSSQNRVLSSSSSDPEKKSSNETSKEGGDDTTKGLILTPGEKVVAYSRLFMWSCVAVFAAGCAYFIGKELIPTKMSPNTIFDKSLVIVRNSDAVKRRYGDTIKGFGRDHGGHREGRRNFIDYTEYTDPDDGSKRVRVRYNIEGRFGNAFVFVEVSSAMPSGEFVYLLVQDKSNGRVETLIDNRSAITAQRLSGGDEKANSIMSQLLTGGGKK